MINVSSRLVSAGPVAFGIRRLMTTHPWYATLIDRWTLVRDDSVETMGVSMGGDLRVQLRFNLEFVAGLPADELENVLLHEALHVVFGHLKMRPIDYPDRGAWVIATETTVNEFVPDPLPGTPIRLEMFPELPRWETTQKRYERLASSQRAQSASPIDNHGLWGVGSGGNLSDETIDAVVAADIRSAIQNLPEELQARAIEELSRVLQAKEPGSTPGSELLRLPKRRTPSARWAEVLRSMVWTLAQPTPVLHRPSRRLPHLVGVVPGKIRPPEKPTVLVILDTSGSMIDEDLLATVRTEVHSLSALAALNIVECDTQIQREYVFRGDVEEIAGGGGTSFVEPLTDEFLAKRQAKLVVYFTDGYGAAPDKAPRIPVVWCLIGEDSQRPAPWGRVIRIPSSRP